MAKIRRRFMPAIVTLALLAGLTAESRSRPRPEDAEPYHRRAREACEAMPRVIGEWVTAATDLPIPPAAVALLRPNVLLHREYRNQTTGRSVNFLLVQCRSARDMLGHYPPVCYPGQGWEKRSQTAVEWPAGPRAIPGMEYEFAKTHEGQPVVRVVSNIIIVPGGRFVRDMNEVGKAAGDYLRQFYGAAQIQMVVWGEVPAEERRQIVSTFLGAHQPMLDALCSGGTK